jgi:hypothetical protein
METTRGIRTKTDFIALILIISVSAVLAYGYFNRIDRPKYEARLELHNKILRGTAPSPYRYRVLVPFTGEALTRSFSVVLPHKEAFLLSYLIYDFLAIFILLYLLFIWSSIWFSREQALIGVLFVAGTMPIALQDHFFQPWSLLEVGLFTAALLAIHSKRYWLLAAIVVLASLNRETAVLIPLVFLLASLDQARFLKPGSRIEWKPVVQAGGLLLLWAAVFLGIRYFQGSTAHTATIREVLAKNTTERGLFYTFVNGGLFLGGFWVFAVLGFRYAPRLIRRITWIVPLYLVTVLVWGVWYEVRLLMPLYPVLVPLGLSFIFRRGMRDGAA